jgi:hypothetical protein
MKIIITELQYKKLFKETIRASEAYDDYDALMSVVNGKRGVCFLVFYEKLNFKKNNQRKFTELAKKMIRWFNLEYVRIPSHPLGGYIVFNPDFKNDAIKLWKIAEKYKGYLSYKATKEETREIGRILSYDENDINDFINKNYINENRRSNNPPFFANLTSFIKKEKSRKEQTDRQDNSNKSNEKQKYAPKYYNDLISNINEYYWGYVDTFEFIENFIKKSGCEKIEFDYFKIKEASGLSLHDGILLNKFILGLKYPMFLYVLFHEIAHQYQFKKYGIEKMYKIYTNEISINEAIEFMKYLENIADDFALRKLREMVKLNYLSKYDIQDIKPVHKEVELSHFDKLNNMMREKVKEKNITDPIKVGEIFYNWLKEGI